MTYFNIRNLQPSQEPKMLTRIRTANLATFDASSQRFTPIPAACSALEIGATDWSKLEQDGRAVLAAMRRAVAWLAEPKQKPLMERMYSELSPLEKQLALDKKALSRPCATVRMDLFFGENALHIIEVNATIPAMQAYSDMIATAFVDAAGMPPLRFTNTDQLLASLLAHAGLDSKAAVIGIVSRLHDSQTAELQWYQHHWQKRGHRVLLFTPDQISIRDDKLYGNGIKLDFCYRHIFASRLTSDSAFHTACARSPEFRVYNPVAAHMEIKALLALISRAVEDDVLRVEIGMTSSECAAIAARVPWTRFIERHHLKRVQEHASQFVLKSSSGYGGHRVIVGSLASTQVVQEQMAQIAGRAGKMEWQDFVAWCSLAEAGLWIVQQKISGVKVEHRYIDRDDTVKSSSSYIDCSIFLNEGVAGQVNGPASRFAPDPVVNIGRGGGVMPVYIV